MGSIKKFKKKFSNEDPFKTAPFSCYCGVYPEKGIAHSLFHITNCNNLRKQKFVFMNDVSYSTTNTQ